MDPFAQLPLLHGLPDDMTGAVSLDATGKLRVALPGSALFRMHLPVTEQARMPRVYVQADKAVRLPADARGMPVVNYVADPDRCSHSLLQILRIVDTLGSPCFNAPRAVARTGRHAVARALAPIPGLHMPRTELIDARCSRDLVDRIEAAGLRYPLLLRAPGMHMGATMAKVDAPEAVDAAVFDMPLQRRGIYVTEFVDYRDADGLYRKMRLAVVGKRVFMRHFAIASDWNVHIRDRIRMDDPEETRMVDGFPGSVPMDAPALALQVAEALDLDYFGIDCCPRPDGRLLVFEANAAMDILAPEVSPTRQADWDRRIGAISQALQDLLRDPSQWRHNGNGDGGS